LRRRALSKFGPEGPLQVEAEIWVKGPVSIYVPGPLQSVVHPSRQVEGGRPGTSVMAEDREVRFAAERGSAHPEAAGVVPGGVGGGVPIASYIVLVLPRLITDHGVGSYPIIVRHVIQGAVVPVPGLIGKGRPRVLVEAIIGDQAGFIPGEVAAHVVSNFCCRACNIPNPDLI